MQVRVLLSRPLQLINFMEKENTEQMELDTTDWSKEMFFALLKESCERDVSVNKVIADMLGRYLTLIQENTDE